MSTSTLHLITKSIVDAFAPLEEYFADSPSFEDFMLRLGWAVTDLPPSYQLVTSLVTEMISAVESLPQDPDLDEIRIVLGKIDDIYNAINSVDEVPGGIDANVDLFLQVFSAQMIEVLMVDYLIREVPVLFNLLQIVGVIEHKDFEATATRPAYVRTSLHFDQIPNVLSNLPVIPALVYGWGTENLDTDLLLEHLLELAIVLNLPASLDYVDPDLASGFQEFDPSDIDKPMDVQVSIPVINRKIGSERVQLEVAVLELPAAGSSLPGLILVPKVHPAITGDLEINEQLTLRLRALGTDSSIFGLVLRPDDVSIRHPFEPTEELPAEGFAAELVYASEAPVLLLGSSTLTRLEFGGFKSGLSIGRSSGEIELTVSVGLEDMRFVLPAEDLGDILKELTGGDIVIPFSFAAAWSTYSGLSFSSGAGLAVSVFPDVTVGPIHVVELKLAVRGTSEPNGSPGLMVRTGVTLNGSLGPVTLVVTDLGLDVAVAFGEGNAGPFDLAVGFAPPNGLGLSIAAGPISGGGFLQRGEGPPERYAGALNLKLTRFSVAAFGVFERLSNGRISAAIVLGIRFSPGIQLGFGFVLTGVGGLFGLNRRANVDALKAQLAKGTAGNVLFADNPVKNAPTLLGDLRTLFPTEQGVHIVGPTVQITWLAPLARFDLGIFIELPGPSKILIIGVARIEVGGNQGVPSLVKIRCDIFGVIDLSKNLIALDAKLINSTLLQVFKLTGDAAFRLSNGSDPYAMLTVGGFHPAFNPEPAVFSSLERITLAYDKGGLWLRMESYLAITSNTLQHGAKIEVGIEDGSLSADGLLAYDALIQFVPFYFTIDLEARVRVRWRGKTFASVGFSGNLSGPGPIVLRGKFCLSFFFFSVCFDDSFTLGTNVSQAVTGVTSLVPVVAQEFTVAANLEATGEDKQVVLSANAAATSKVIVITPLGDLVWTQKRVPLNVAVERFEGVPLKDRPAQAVIVHLADNGATDSAAEDWFRPGTFISLSESEALNRPAFQREEAGRRISFEHVASAPVENPVTTKTFRLPDTTNPLTFAFEKQFAPALLDAVLERRGRPQVFPKAPLIGVQGESWMVYSAQGTPVFTGLTLKQTDAHQRARYQKGTTALPTADGDEGIVLRGL